MFNGYNRDLMTRERPYPGIPAYLNKENPKSLTIPRAIVTHICCTGDSEFGAEHVALCSNIRNIVKNPTAVIGQVDAVIIATDIATDIGGDHMARTRPFLFSETIELMQLVIAGKLSRDKGGRTVELN